MGCASSTDAAKPHPQKPHHHPKKTHHKPEEWVLKYDHFENIHKLDKKFEGSPNLRKVSKLPVFGTGQPTVEAFKQIVDYVSVEHGLTRIVWTNMRQEPVIFVNGESFTPREHGRLNENMEFDNVDGDHLGQLTDSFAQVVRDRSVSSNGHVSYFRDTYAEHPADRKNIEHRVPLNEVLSLSEVYGMLQSTGVDIVCLRLPIADECAPRPEDLDLLVASIKDEPEGTALFFNCQMGKGRTTTGMLCACVVKEAKSGKMEAAHEENLNATPLERADFAVVRTVVGLLPNGEKAKQQLDRICDLTGPPHGLQNLRECIGWTKEKFDSEPDAKKPYWKHMAANFVERYCYLLAFCSYVDLCAKDNFKITFKDWLPESVKKAVAESKETFAWQL